MSDIKILAIDFGERRIGLAIGDLENKIATPLKTIKNISYESILKEISLIVVEWEINQIVIGIPESYPDQNINKQITNFSKILRKKLKIDVILFNEDFSSNYAQSDLASQMKAGRKKKINKEEIDRIAATIILQSYFENEIFKRANKRTTSKD
jgi:putative Holliday junction resolvase